VAVERPKDAAQALVVVPTYNERESIAEAMRRLFDAAGDTVDLLVVDDGSPDGTAELVKQMTTGPHGVHLLERSEKLGLGTAYVAGFGWALQRGYKAVVEMDADLSHDPADVPRLLAELDGADLVIGSRYVPGGNVRNWGRIRRALSMGGNWYARTLLRIPAKDSTSGFRAYSADFLSTQHLADIASHGYSFQIEMTLRAYLDGRTVKEIPITFVERASGRSKMSRRIVIEAIWRVTRWGIKDRLRRRGART
jgi:glycosyltransferase involved in cell wall biosynthesis